MVEIEDEVGVGGEADLHKNKQTPQLVDAVNKQMRNNNARNPTDRDDVEANAVATRLERCVLEQITDRSMISNESHCGSMENNGQSVLLRNYIRFPVVNRVSNYDIYYCMEEECAKTVSVFPSREDLIVHYVAFHPQLQHSILQSTLADAKSIQDFLSDVRKKSGFSLVLWNHSHCWLFICEEEAKYRLSLAKGAKTADRLGVKTCTAFLELYGDLSVDSMIGHYCLHHCGHTSSLFPTSSNTNDDPSHEMDTNEADESLIDVEEMKSVVGDLGETGQTGNYYVTEPDDGEASTVAYSENLITDFKEEISDSEKLEYEVVFGTEHFDQEEISHS